MEHWYEKAIANLIKRPYYDKAVNLVYSASYADTSFLNQCISAIDKLCKCCDECNHDIVSGVSTFVTVVGTGRVAQLVIKDVLLPKKIPVKVLSLGCDTVHAERIAELGPSITTDLNILLTAKLIFLCLPTVDSSAVEAHISNFNLEDKVIRFTGPQKPNL